MLLTITVASSQEAKAETNPPNGFYNLGTNYEFIPVASFLTKPVKDKRKIIAGDYYFIINGEVYKALDIVLLTDVQLNKSKITINELEKKFDVTIDANGKVTSGKDGFEVVGIE